MWKNNPLCCGVTNGACHAKFLSTGKSKFGFGALNSENSIRRWLTQTGFATDVNPTRSYSFTNTINRYTGAFTQTFTGTGFPGPDILGYINPGVTDYVYTLGGYHHEVHLTNEYTDAMVLQDAIALLPGAWGNLPLDSAAQLFYDTNGNPQMSTPTQPSGVGGYYGAACLYPPYDDGEIFPMAGCSLSGSQGTPTLSAYMTRFYVLPSQSLEACLMTIYADAGAGAALPALPAICALAKIQTDASGNYIEMLPPPLIDVDDLRFYNTAVALLNPYTNPNHSNWPCNCDNEAP